MAEKEELSLATRFSNKVIASYADVAKGVEITQKERTLIANYFIKIDESLKNSKQGYNWKMVRMDELSLSVANLAKMGLDMAIPGTVSFIPFRVKDTGSIRLTPCIGVKGYEFLAKRFGVDPPDNLVVELIYSNDKFSLLKKDANHEYESYIFEVTNPFDRGEIIGAVAALEYKDKMKNKVMAMSLKELLSYKPDKADPTFWGGGENRKKMLEKTIGKQILKKVALDPEKMNSVRDSMKYIESEELVGASLDAQETVRENNGVGDYIDIDFEPIEEVENVENHVEDVESEQPEATDAEFTLF